MLERDNLIGFQVRALTNAVKRDMERSKFIPDSARGVHGWAISYLIDNEKKEMFQRDFENAFSIRRSTATKILQVMEKKGLIVRESVGYDARLKKIVLTQKAYEINDCIEKNIMRREEKMKTGISEKDLDCFFTVIKKMKKNLEDFDD